MKNKIALVESLIFTYQSKENMVPSVIEDDNLWLTQKSLADLFECGVNTVNYHINEIYASNELDEKSTFRNFRIVQKEGNREVERIIGVLAPHTSSKIVGTLNRYFKTLLKGKR